MNNFTKMLAILVYYQHNFRILHWNVKGKDFDQYHQLMKEYSDKLEEYVDQIAEMAVMTNDAPVSFQTTVSILTNDDSTAYYSADITDTYTSEMIVECIDIMFGHILTALKNLMDYHKVQNNPVIKTELENMYAYFDKELNYKNKRRL